MTPTNKRLFKPKMYLQAKLLFDTLFELKYYTIGYYRDGECYDSTETLDFSDLNVDDITIDEDEITILFKLNSIQYQSLKKLLNEIKNNSTLENYYDECLRFRYDLTEWFTSNSFYPPETGEELNDDNLVDKPSQKMKTKPKGRNPDKVKRNETIRKEYERRINTGQSRTRIKQELAVEYRLSESYINDIIYKPKL